MNFPGFEYEFSADKVYCGFHEFLCLPDLRNSGLRQLKNSCNGFIVNDTCIIEVGIFVTKCVDENKEYKSFCKIDENLMKEKDSPLFHLMLRSSFQKMEPNFVPLLEEVCLKHPSLVVSLEKRSCKFSKWAFTALGRVLHFLRTKKVEDMDEEACNHLQILWDELKTCGFDLSWLEFYVEAALNRRKWMDNVDKMRRNLSTLNFKEERLKACLTETKTELEMASKDLRKAEKRLKESIWMPDHYDVWTDSSNIKCQ